MVKYAILDSQGRVKLVNCLSDKLANPPNNYVEIPDTTDIGDIIGKVYVGNGNFTCANTVSSVNVEPRYDWTPYVSTQEVYRDEDMTKVLENDLDSIESSIATLQSTVEELGGSHTHTLDDISETDIKKIMTAAERTKLIGIAENANNYTHPTTHPASMITGLPQSLPANGGNADTVDGKHASDFSVASHNHDTDYAAISHNHTQAQVSGLGTALNGKADVSHTHEQADITGLNTALAGKANTSHTHTQYATTDHNHNSAYSGINHNHDTDYADISHTHAQSDITGLSTTLNSKAESNHNHNSSYISKTLQATNDSGGVEYSYGANSGKNVLNEISGMSKGFHTIYAIYGTDGNPDTTESYRYFIYKSSDTIGWVQAFGSSGSVYTNYLNGDTGWLGWKTIFDATPQALWNGENNGTGGYIMNASHTVTPSKPLSQCRNGWVLLWADFDPDTHTFNDYDFCTTVIPKKKPNNANWAGQPFICPIASYLKNASPYDSETIRVKTLHVHDNKLVGHAANTADNRNDIVLRAVYEY